MNLGVGDVEPILFQAELPFLDSRDADFENVRQDCIVHLHANEHAELDVLLLEIPVLPSQPLHKVIVGGIDELLKFFPHLFRHGGSIIIRQELAGIRQFLQQMLLEHSKGEGFLVDDLLLMLDFLLMFCNHTFPVPYHLINNKGSNQQYEHRDSTPYPSVQFGFMLKLLLF